MQLRSKYVSTGAAFLVLVCGLLAPFDELPTLAQRAAGVALFAVILWTARPIPLELSSLLVLIIMPLTGLLSFQQTFAPFAGPTIWLVFAGMVLSVTVEATGLGDSVAKRGFAGIAGGPLRLIISLHALGLGLAFLIPSGVIRVLLLTPVASAILSRLGAQENRQTSAVVYLSLLCSTYFGGSGILTGSVPNLVVAGQLEHTTGLVVYWGEFLEWMFPVIGFSRVVVSAIVIWLLFGRKLDPGSWIHLRGRTDTSSEPLDRAQRSTLFILLLGIGLWASDLIHHLAPVYIGLLLTVLCVLPSKGPLPLGHLKRVDFPFFFYLAALFSVGTALQKSGFNSSLIDSALQSVDMAAYDWFGRHLAMTFLVLPLNFFMDTAAVAGVAMPTMIDLGQTYGMSDLSTAMSVAMATSLIFLPYQAAPFMVALQTGRFTFKQLVACTMGISTFSLLALCPLNVLYWRWIGLI